MKRKIFYPIALVAVLACVLFACRKEIVDVFVESVTIEPPQTDILNVGSTLTLVATVKPDDAFNQTVRWTSSNTALATVNDNGVVTALAPGEVTIIATTEDGGFTATCTVNVIRQVTSVTINPKSLSLIVGNNATLTAEFTPGDASNQAVTWTNYSNNLSVATVDAKGVVTALSEGTATIRATSQQDATKYDDCVVTVTKAIVPVVDVKLNHSAFALTTGNTVNLYATVIPANATNQTVSWSSDNESVATVNNNGVVTAAVSSGIANITVTTADGNHQENCVITVSAPVIFVEGIFFVPDLPLTLEIDPNPNVKPTPTTLSYTIEPANATNQSVVWASSNTSVAEVDDNGAVTPKAVGTTVISVTALDGSGQTATCIVTVNTNKPVESVSLTTDTTIYGSETTTLTARILPLDATNQDVTWKSSDETVATVSGTTGLTSSVTPLKAGTTTIKVITDDGNKEATCVVTVKEVPVADVTIELDEDELEFDLSVSNDPIKLNATVGPSTLFNKKVIWTSSDHDVAEVSGSGFVSPKGVGTAIITATTEYGSKTADCEVTVE